MWLELPAKIDTLTLHHEAMEAGISISPGPMFSARRAFRNCLRLNYSHPWSDQMERAIRKLGKMAGYGR